MPTFLSWEQVAEKLRENIGPATEDQLRLAESIGLHLVQHTPRIVAGAQLREAMYIVLAEPPSRAPTQRQSNQIEEMRLDADPEINVKTSAEAEAWIQYLYVVRRIEALAALDPRAGDVVESSIRGDVATISSIGADGRLYFKGGLGRRAWPDLVHMRARQDDFSHEANQLRIDADNTVAERQATTSWSWSKHLELEEFNVGGDPTSIDAEGLERAIEEAEDERPVQAYLEKNPELLAVLLAGHFRYVLPQKRLGAEFVPDFAIAKTDSLGVDWTLIELESPRNTIFLEDGIDLGKQARKAVSQIEQWRDWLENNLAYARKSRSEKGLGLFDIRARPKGIVIIGRRHLSNEKGRAKRNELNDQNIHLHSYDWLMECIRGSMGVGRVPGNPYLIGRDRVTAY